MILDKAACFGEEMDAMALSDWVDLSEVTSEVNRDRMGPGEPILILVVGHGFRYDSALGDPRIVVIGRYTEVAPAGPEMELAVGPYTMAAGGVIFGLSTSTSPSIQLQLTGLADGKWSAYVVLRAL